MAYILLGNNLVLEPYKEDEGTTDFQVRPLPELGQQLHSIGIPHDWTFSDGMAHVERFVAASFGEPPAWVESDSEAYALAISEHYSCPVGRPEEWTEGVQEEVDNGTE